MIPLNRPQRDFLDRFYTEYMKLEPGPAMKLGYQRGFHYGYLTALWTSYIASWGDGWGRWGDGIEGIYPPDPGTPLAFPWSSIQELDDQMSAAGMTADKLGPAHPYSLENFRPDLI